MVCTQCGAKFCFECLTLRPSKCRSDCPAYHTWIDETLGFFTVLVGVYLVWRFDAVRGLLVLLGLGYFVKWLFLSLYRMCAG